MTKAEIKFFQSLSRQKYRKEHNAYLVEGDKNAREWLLSETRITHIAALPGWLEAHTALTARHPEALVIPCADFELEKISSLQHAQQVVLVAQQPAAVRPQWTAGDWYLYLDRIQDPGNMGTIIRTADWFGISAVLCSPECVERYNPKVVQATMGSLLRVPVYTITPAELLATRNCPLYATTLDGRAPGSVDEARPGGIIAMGNESQGLDPVLSAAADHKLCIPGRGGAESLNVSVAAGIICALLTAS